MKIFILTLLSSTLFLHPPLIKAQGDQQYNCYWDYSIDSCEVDLSSVSCHGGWSYDPRVCNRYDEVYDENGCLEDNPRECIPPETDNPFKCAAVITGWECQECLPEPDGTYPQDCVYANADACTTFCPSNRETYLCTDNGCEQSACETSNPLCFSNAIACEISGCTAVNQDCPNLDRSDCESDPRCEYVEGACQDRIIYEFSLCRQAGTHEDRCLQCLESQGIWTAIGCISYSQPDLIASLVTVGTSIAGGIAILLILYGSFTITTSSSNPQRLQTGKEIVTAAIIGLVLILFSVIALQFVGVEILRIPGL